MRGGFLIPKFKGMTREELIEKLKGKKINLSYSWLKKFTSPINFLNYKLEQKAPNAGMLFGSLCDLLLLTPKRLHLEFTITDNVPTTDKQNDFSNEVIEAVKAGRIIEGEEDEELLQDIFSKHYAKGTFHKTFEPLKPYIYARSNKKDVVSTEMLNEARELTKKLLSYPDIKKLFSQISGVQTKIDYTINGWRYIGFLDFYTPNAIFDLKYNGKGADPEEFEREIRNKDYDLQGGGYCRGAHEMGIFDYIPPYFWLVYDKTGNYSIIEADYGYIAYGMRKLDYLIQSLDKCVRLNAWDQSYNFFKRTYTAYKPKWAKAYLLEGEAHPEEI